jgi:hypothetical protein
MQLTLKNTFVAAAFLLSVFIIACNHHNDSTTVNNVPPPITSSTNVLGYNLLSKICGIWNGAVTSTTPLGNYPVWIVDFRPISASQVSAKNELDSLNNIFMSFFIVYDSSQYKLAFRNGGGFAGMVRVSYAVCDSVTETSTYSYYRFVDFIKGSKRDIVEVSFYDDSLHIKAYTNVNNSLPSATQVHMDWHAVIQDTTSYQPAKNAFSFPQKTMVKNFSNTFTGDVETVFYTFNGDPYPESAQPYLGQSTLSYTVSPTLPTIPSGAPVYLIVTTQPLIGNTGPIFANLIYRSRYVILSNPDNSFLFNYMHPGSYYLYAFYDADGNGTLSPGDYVSTANTAFTLAPLGTVSASTQINYVIP